MGALRIGYLEQWFKTGCPESTKHDMGMFGARCTGESLSAGGGCIAMDETAQRLNNSAGGRK